MAFPGVDPVRGEQQPVRGAPIAVFSVPLLSITPEAVPNTGVRNLCSIDRSRGHFSGCRSGKPRLRARGFGVKLACQPGSPRADEGLRAVSTCR
jgi:hypothetical protein